VIVANAILFYPNFSDHILTICSYYFDWYCLSLVVPGINYLLIPGTTDHVLVMIQLFDENKILIYVYNGD